MNNLRPSSLPPYKASEFAENGLGGRNNFRRTIRR